MATAIRNIRMTPEQYLAEEEKGELRHEYANGFTYAQAGASRAHNLLAHTLSSILRGHLRGGGPYRTYIADMKVRILSRDLDLFYYPDVMVSCDPSPPHDYYEDKPKLLVEVLSERTESRDRLEKLNAYTQLPSLEEYLLIAQHKVAVDIYRRQDDGFELERLGDDDTLNLQSVGLRLPVRELYEDIIGLIG